MPTLASALNAAHSISAGCLVSQAFDGAAGLFQQHNGVTEEPSGAAYSWVVPQLTANHTACTAIVQFARFPHGSSPGGLNVAGVISITSGGSTLASVTLGSSYTVTVPQTVSLSLVLPYNGSEHSTVNLEVSWPAYVNGGTNDDTAFHVRRFQLFANPLASPLSAGKVATSGGELVPLGQGATATGAPFSAALGMAIINDLSAIDKRRKPIFAWSALRISGTLETAGHILGHWSTVNPPDFDPYGSALVRNCPGGLRLRIIATLKNGTGTDSPALFAATPVGTHAFPSGGFEDGAALGTLSLVAPANQTTTVSGTVSITTPSTLSRSNHSHIRIGLVSPKTHAAHFDDGGLVYPSVLGFSIWIAPT